MLPRVARFFQELALITLLKFINLSHLRTAWHQDKPGIVIVIDQQKATEGKVADCDGVLGQLRMKLEHIFPLAVSRPNSPLIVGDEVK
jgi:hypothetical protein